MATESKLRRAVADWLLIVGVFFLVGAQFIGDWVWFAGLLLLAAGTLGLSLFMVPFHDQLRRLGRARVQDATHTAPAEKSPPPRVAAENGNHE